MKVRILATCTFSTLDDRWHGTEAELGAEALRAAGFEALVMPENHPDRDECGIGAFVEAWRDVEIDEPGAVDDISARMVQEIERIVGNTADVFEWPTMPLDRPPFRHDDLGRPI